MKKAVFSPGTGYTCKEDLFQRIGQELGQAGWSVVLLDWQVIPFKDIDTIAEACDMAVGFAICALEGEGLEDCDDLLFVFQGGRLVGSQNNIFIIRENKNCLCVYLAA